ncbi:MAG: site-specific integrase [Oscillospiraceae bacterium]|nr:site-specific integrase [Oscillospiraceae bacterium]
MKYTGTSVVVLAIYYGLRRSEVLGLKWSTIDFENDTITISHTVVKNRTIVASDCTKSEASRRTFQLIPEVNAMLQEMKATAPPNSEYIHVWQDGKAFRPDYVTRGFQRVLKRNNIPRMRLHDLRHSTASILFERGMPLEDMKNWLGHTDIETTSNIYLHYSKNRKELVASQLHGMLTI